MRKQAMKWWNSLEIFEQDDISTNIYKRKYTTLTGSEIELLYERKSELLNDLMNQTFHCDDLTAKKIVDEFVYNNKQILLFYDLSFLYKV
jgi:hypothetical protein